ncbi:MAG TPA: glycosyltransferase family 2 protein [Candidatus Nanoarchaeia archaeon]|nr:glycosyltransferase family 2 protein [Candidatus Nanoarchaeia archaeon]
MGVVIVIPARNEASTIASVVHGALCHGSVAVVDDGSTDATTAEAETAGAVVLQHVVNLGKGCALKTGCDYALMEGADRIVVLDADAQHDPAQIPDFLNALKTHDIVFGYRTFTADMPGILRFGNKFISRMTTTLYGISLRDTQCGYRAFTADAYKKLRWRAQDYSVESEMISNTGKQGLRYTEISIPTVYHNKYKGTTVLDGIRIVLKMIWWKVSS